MRILSGLGRILASWWVAGPILAILGIAIGYGLFFYALPAKPKIGVIDIPFTGISEDSAAIITSFLEYSRRNPEIKGVVIKMASPGGGASASEQLYHETARLRAEKPVVMVINGMMASGGYMMAVGANHTYAKTSSLVGNIGVVAGTGPIFPPQIPEQFAFTGPYKLTGVSRRDWISDLDMLKEAFVEMVVRERGDKLKISREELGDGKLYTGMEAVALGLVDEIGSDTEAYKKVAELAGIRSYSLVNVNVEVNRLFVQDLRRIYSSTGDVNEPLTESDIDMLRILAGRNALPDQIQPSQEAETTDFPDTFDQVEIAPYLDGSGFINRPLEYGVFGVPTEQQFPNLPLDMNRPQFYYLYVGADH
jgi:signal peptide peptidase SppA